jgi:hypothetical protein
VDSPQAEYYNFPMYGTTDLLLQTTGQGNVPAFIEKPGCPYSPIPARVVLSMPGAPLLLRTVTHARHRMSLRMTLSGSSLNLRPGPALAAR